MIKPDRTVAVTAVELQQQRQQGLEREAQNWREIRDLVHG